MSKKIKILLWVLLAILLGIVSFRKLYYGETRLSLKKSKNVNRIILKENSPLSQSIVWDKNDKDEWTFNQNRIVDAQVMEVYLDVFSTILAKGIYGKEKIDELKKNSLVKKGQLTFYRNILFFSYPLLRLHYYIDSVGIYVQKGKEILYEIHSPVVDLQAQNYFSTNEQDWKSLRMLNLALTQIKNVSISYPKDSTLNFEIENISGHFVFKPIIGQGQRLDTALVYDFLSGFTEIYADNFVNGLKLSSVPMQELSIENKKGELYRIRLYPKENDPFQLYAITENQTDTLLMSYYMIDKWQKKRKDFFW